MSSRHALHRTTELPGATTVDLGRRAVTVRSVSRFAGVHQVIWRDGRHKRRILVAIDHWTGADQTIRDAVAATYPVDDRPTVIVPPQAWH
jgi:hypothetical protein